MLPEVKSKREGQLHTVRLIMGRALSVPEVRFVQANILDSQDTAGKGTTGKVMPDTRSMKCHGEFST
jgi:hypothetical protein